MKYLTLTLTLILSLAILGGCTSYSVKREVDPNTGVLLTEVNVRSTRDLEQPVVEYTRTGKDATFNFQAASVDNNTEAMLGLFQGMMSTMMQMMQQMMQQAMVPPNPQINVGATQ